MIIEFWKNNENPITCYESRKNNEPAPAKIPKKRQKNIKQPVMVEFPNGEKKKYPSVAEASVGVGMNVNTLYAFLNGRAKNTTEFTIYKLTMNN